MVRTPLNIQSPYLLLYLLTSLLPRTLTSPPPLDSILARQNTSPPASNNLSAILPPPEFSSTISSTTNNIPQRACFALTSLAALSFDSHLDSAKHARSAYFPGMKLRLAGPNDQGGLDVKYAVWGLTKAIQPMTAIVGTIRFIKTPPGGAGDTNTIGANATFPTQTRSQTQILLPTNDQSEDGSLGSSLIFSATFIGRPIAFRDAMMAIIGGLTLTAVNDKDEWVDSRVFNGFFPSNGGQFVLVKPAIALLPYYHVKSGLVTDMMQASTNFYLFRSESRELRIVVMEGPTIIAAGALVLRGERDIGMDRLGTGRNNVSTS